MSSQIKLRGTTGKLNDQFVPYLLNMASVYIDCCQYDKAQSILLFLQKKAKLNPEQTEQSMLLQSMILFHKSEFKKCVNISLKIYKTTNDEAIQRYLLLTINKCFVALKGRTEAKKYLNAYLNKLNKYGK
jgi:outer membrane PBP1 activator LpoA protein